MAGITYKTVAKLIQKERDLVPGEPIVLGTPPRWAVALLLQISFDYRRKDIPTLIWYRMSRHTGSSGVTQTSRWLKRNVISVRAGKKPEDVKHVVLHEVAHWLAGCNEGHSLAFYRVLFELLHAYHRDGIAYAVDRERKYQGYVATRGYDSWQACEERTPLRVAAIARGWEGK